MHKISTLIAATVFAAAAANVSALPITVYETDFESGLDSVWSSGSHTSAHATLSNYNGQYYRNGSSTLTLTGLDAHSQIALEFDLYLFMTWDGNDSYWGPDYFGLSGDVNASWTFTNHQSEGQTYVGTPDEVYGSGASATHVYRTFGPEDFSTLDPSDVLDEFLISHTDGTFSITFQGPTTQSDEQWGIDNVRVSIDGIAVPAPTSIFVFTLGLLGLLMMRRRSV